MNYTLDMAYQDIGNIVTSVAKDEWKPELIVGIQRGGLVPAVMLSHKLSVKMKVLPWSTRDWNDRSVPFDVQLAHDYSKKRILIVDDIIDSGQTVRDLMPKLPKARFAALIWNIRVTDASPHYFGRTIDREIMKDWVNFFWEVK